MKQQLDDGEAGNQSQEQNRSEKAMKRRVRRCPEASGKTSRT